MTVNKPMLLTQRRLREVLDYNPNTGKFFWKVLTGPNASTNKEAGWKMKKDGRMIQIDGKGHYAHRLAWLYVYGIEPSGDIDHINGDKLDNRLINLRNVTRAQNRVNVSGVQKNNTSGYLGVDFHLAKKSWQARISFNGDRLFLGYFDTPERASLTYQAVKRILHPTANRVFEGESHA